MWLKLTFYVPRTHVDAVKDALFEAGAGHYEGYDCCCWQVLGRGQFRPLAGSRPHVGVQDELDTVDEYRVEMICKAARKATVRAALFSAHPYEVPAYDFVEIAR